MLLLNQRPLDLSAGLKTPISVVAADVGRLKYLGFCGPARAKVRASLRRLLIFKQALKRPRTNRLTNWLFTGALFVMPQLGVAQNPPPTSPSATLVATVIPAIAPTVANPPRNGKLLRSELWQPFDAASAKGDFFVSPTGNDHWSGTLAEPNSAGTDGPFATLPRAQQAVRELKRKVYLPKAKAIDARYVGTAYPFGKGQDIVVFIRQGYYPLTEPLRFTPEDGGERVETTLPSGAFEWHHLRDNYVTYAAYPGETPVISGAQAVTHWRKDNNVWVAPSPLTNVSDLIANGRKQTLARTPNTGYCTLRATPASSSEIPCRPGDLQSWEGMEGNRIVILLRWRTAYNRIARIDASNHIAFLQQPEDGPGGNNGLLVVPPRYYVENVKALLDAPGEWFFDQHRKEISYIPAAGISDPNQAHLSVPQLRQLVQVQGDEKSPVRNLRFAGLIFEGAKDDFRDFPHHYDPTPGCVAISWDYAADCEFGHCTLRTCGGVGMFVGSGCGNTRIFRNTFASLEQGALGVSGVSDLAQGRLVQVTRATTIEHNIFTECGQGGGITLSVGGALQTTIAHNYFTKSGRPYTINCGGGGLEGSINGDCLVEYNHFEDVQHDADDAGVIVVNGMTFNSQVRNNLIHQVHRGFFSDNVAFWFDNMSSHWTVTNNLYYDLQQGEMKTCGTYLVDNNYADNFAIEAPQHPPEQFIEGEPRFTSSNLRITRDGQPVGNEVLAGTVVKVRADVTNLGSSGAAAVALYVDRQAVETRPFPVIRNNTRTIEFELRLSHPGHPALSIGQTPLQTIVVTGLKPSLVYDQVRVSEQSLLAGESLRVTARAVNLESNSIQATVPLLAAGKEIGSQPIELKSLESREVHFDFAPAIGRYPIRIGNSEEVMLKVARSRKLKLEPQELHTYISPKAHPAKVEFDSVKNHYVIKASGWDFYHAEDAYATVYLKRLTGDFVSTAKITAFGTRTSEWYRAGLFVRNDLSQSFDVDRGSKGSVLMFSTPGRAGMEYDEFGDGCMHKAASENLPEFTATPIWVRLERHGNRFTGAVSLDGKTWIIKRQTNPIPGLGASVDLGLAAGAPDQKQYTVEFEDWNVTVEAE